MTISVLIARRHGRSREIWLLTNHGYRGLWSAEAIRITTSADCNIWSSGRIAISRGTTANEPEAMSYLPTDYADPYDVYMADRIITIYTKKIAARKRISRRGVPLAMKIAVRRLKRYANQTGYQLCSTPEFFDPHMQIRAYDNYVHVHARVIPKGYLPENTLLSGTHIKVIDHTPQIKD